MIAALESLGVSVVQLPLLEIVKPPDGGAALVDAIDGLADYTWVAFTSANAVSTVMDALADRPWPAHVRCAVVGNATGRAVSDRGLSVDVVADPSTAAHLARQMPVDETDRVLAPLATLASDDLVDGLTDRGVSALRVDAYATTAPIHSADAIDRALASDLVLLTAPSVVNRLVELADGRSVPAGICIGPRTNERAQEFALAVEAVADPHDDDGLLAAVASVLSESPPL